MLKNFVRIGSICLSLAIAAGCGGGSTGPSNNGTGTGTGTGGGYGDPGPTSACPSNTFCMRDATFEPTTLTVAANAAVAFQNTSGVTHHVVFDAPASAKAVGTGNSGDIGDISSGTVQRTWTAAGTYKFHCTIHAGMAGTVTVQ